MCHNAYYTIRSVNKGEKNEQFNRNKQDENMGLPVLFQYDIDTLRNYIVGQTHRLFDIQHSVPFYNDGNGNI